MTNNETNNSRRGILADMIPFATGEWIVAGLVCLGFFILDLAGLYRFDFTVLMGAVLGSTVMILNHLFLCVKVDLEIKKFVDLRGDREMDDEEAEAFAKKHSTAIQSAISLSFVIRTVSILAALVVAFLTGWFNPIAAAIPMFAFRPLLNIINLIESRRAAKPDPSKFIKYDDENNESKEDE